MKQPAHRKKTERPAPTDDSKKREIELKRLERRIQELENEIACVEVAMAANPSDYEELDRLYCRRENLNRELEQLMELWLSFDG